MIRLFRHYISSRALLLLIVEMGIFFLSIYAGSVLRLDTVHPLLTDGSHSLLLNALVFTSIMLFAMIASGLYNDLEWELGMWGMLQRIGAAFTLGLALMMVLFYVFPPLFLGRGLFSISFVTSASLVISFRWLVFHGSNLQGFKHRVLVMGTGTRAAQIEVLTANPSMLKRFFVVGYLAYGGTQHAVSSERILQIKTSLPDFVAANDVDEIILAVRDRRGNLPFKDLLECKLMGIKIIELCAFLEREVGQLKLESLNASWMISSDGFSNGLGRDLNKRIFDLIVSGTLLVFAMPFMLTAALFIFLETGAPVIYRQERVGLNNKPYTIYKFRSMRLDAEKGGVAKWASKNDDRITPLGRILRKLRIDELPQIVNVFKGDMSFVGPRPERPVFVETLAEKIPYYKSRHTIKPGITGWAQVRYAYGASLEDAKEKLQYDLYYVKNHSLFLDILILFQTIQVVLWGKGAR